jgi:hypothetical protein
MLLLREKQAFLDDGEIISRMGMPMELRCTIKPAENGFADLSAQVSHFVFAEQLTLLASELFGQIKARRASVRATL